MERILVLAAHPDDDVLGSGGSIHMWATQGIVVRSVAIADGVSSRLEQPQSAAQRQDSAVAALERLGVVDVSFLGYPDQELDTLSLLTLTQCLTKEIQDFQPTTVVTHSLSDLNLDHRLVAEAAAVACRPQPDSPVRRVLHFEVPSATGWRHGADKFTPVFWTDISESLRAKIEALEFFADEMRPWPHARSLEAIDALARWRGASIGRAAAEAFEVSLFIEGSEVS